MTDEQIDVQIRVESNIDRLSGEAIDRFLADALTSTAEEAAEFLRFIVPKDTGEMGARVGHEAAHEEAGVISAAIGIPPIDRAKGIMPAVKDMYSPGEQDSNEYPLFRDRGTGEHGPSHAPIFARRVSVMKWEGKEGHPIFREETQGSPGSHFMLATYAFAHIALEDNIHKMGERIKHLATPGAAL